MPEELKYAQTIRAHEGSLEEDEVDVEEDDELNEDDEDEDLEEDENDADSNDDY